MSEQRYEVLTFAGVMMPTLSQAEAQSFAKQMERLRATSTGGLFDAVALIREGRDVPRVPYVRDASEPEIVQPWVTLGIHKPLTIIEAAPPDMADQPAARGEGS